MEDIIGDIFISICSTLKSIDKINLTSTNKKMYSKQSTICYNDLMYIDQIIHHKLYHNFTRVLFEAPLKFDEMKYYCGYEIPLCVLPQNIKAMYINHKMHIPSGVTELFFGPYFNEQIDGMIPKNIRKLELGTHFNQNIIGCIPYGVTYLRFGYMFNKPIVDDSDPKNLVFGIPDSVVTLKFGGSFDQSLEKGFPKSVEKLSLGSDYLEKMGSIPPVKILSLHGNMISSTLTIPPTVTTLKFKCMIGKLLPGRIPNSVRTLFISGCFLVPGSIPDGVTHLEFGHSFNSSITGCIPDSVIEIRFGDAFNKSIKKAIPYGVQKITFGEKFSCQLRGNIPKSVTHIILGERSECRKNEILHVKTVETRNTEQLLI